MRRAPTSPVARVIALRKTFDVEISMAAGTEVAAPPASSGGRISETVIDGTDGSSDAVAENEGVHEPNQASEKRDPITRKIVGQQSEVGPHDGAAAQNEDV